MDAKRNVISLTAPLKVWNRVHRDRSCPRISCRKANVQGHKKTMCKAECGWVRWRLQQQVLCGCGDGEWGFVGGFGLRNSSIIRTKPGSQSSLSYRQRSPLPGEMRSWSSPGGAWASLSRVSSMDASGGKHSQVVLSPALGL